MRCQLYVPVVASLYEPEFRGGIWAADLNLGVIGIEMGLKFTRQEENTEE